MEIFCVVAHKICTHCLEFPIWSRDLHSSLKSMLSWNSVAKRSAATKFIIGSFSHNSEKFINSIFQDTI